MATGAQYPASAPEPQFFQALFTFMINIVILTVMISWTFRSIKGAVKGESIEPIPQIPIGGR